MQKRYKSPQATTPTEVIRLADFDFDGMIRSIPDYPSEGIVFKDITTLLKDSAGFAATIDEIADHFAGLGITKVVGAEARGFMIAAPVAYKLHAGFVPARKPGKLPCETVSQAYALEYGTDSLEIHKDAISDGDKVLVVDDIIATGGTAVAQVKMIERLGGEVVGLAFLQELAFLNPRKEIATATDAEVFSLVEVQ